MPYPLLKVCSCIARAKKVISHIYKIGSIAILYHISLYPYIISISVNVFMYIIPLLKNRWQEYFATFIDCIYNWYIHVLYLIKEEITEDKAILHHID